MIQCSLNTYIQYACNMFNMCQCTFIQGDNGFENTEKDTKQTRFSDNEKNYRNKTKKH